LISLSAVYVTSLTQVNRAQGAGGKPRSARLKLVPVIWKNEGEPAKGKKPATGWYKANPALGKFKRADKVRQHFRRALVNTREENSWPVPVVHRIAWRVPGPSMHGSRPVGAPG